jgi:hypothetical protein
LPGNANNQSFAPPKVQTQESQMSHLPTAPRDPTKTDAEHLQLLAIFHFIVAGLAILGLGFVLLHYLLASQLFFNPKMWEGQWRGPPVPAEFLVFMRLFYVFFGTCLMLGGVGNLLSGIWIRARRHRWFSLLVAAINCMQVPIGTILGVFTIIVLMRESVRDSYES